MCRAAPLSVSGGAVRFRRPNVGDDQNRHTRPRGALDHTQLAIRFGLLEAPIADHAPQQPPRLGQVPGGVAT